MSLKSNEVKGSMQANVESENPFNPTTKVIHSNTFYCPCYGGHIHRFPLFQLSRETEYKRLKCINLSRKWSNGRKSEEQLTSTDCQTIDFQPTVRRQSDFQKSPSSDLYGTGRRLTSRDFNAHGLKKHIKKLIPLAKLVRSSLAV